MDGSGPYGQSMLTILAAIAELEMEMFTFRMKENRLARWRDRLREAALWVYLEQQGKED